MNAQNENEDTVQSTAYNAFPEPQTIPSGWDTSVILSASQSAFEEQGEGSIESEMD